MRLGRAVRGVEDRQSASPSPGSGSPSCRWAGSPGNGSLLSVRSCSNAVSLTTCVWRASISAAINTSLTCRRWVRWSCFGKIGVPETPGDALMTLSQELQSRWPKPIDIGILAAWVAATMKKHRFSVRVCGERFEYGFGRGEVVPYPEAPVHLLGREIEKAVESSENVGGFRIGNVGPGLWTHRARRSVLPASSVHTR